MNVNEVNQTNHPIIAKKIVLRFTKNAKTIYIIPVYKTEKIIAFCSTWHTVIIFDIRNQKGGLKIILLDFNAYSGGVKSFSRAKPWFVLAGRH